VQGEKTFLAGPTEPDKFLRMSEPSQPSDAKGSSAGKLFWMMLILLALGPIALFFRTKLADERREAAEAQKNRESAERERERQQKFKARMVKDLEVETLGEKFEVGIKPD
jgi:hypothetical protein